MPSVKEQQVQMVSKQRAAELLDVGIDFISARIADGTIPAVKLGHRTVRIRLKDLENFMNQHPWRNPA